MARNKIDYIADNRRSSILQSVTTGFVRFTDVMVILLVGIVLHILYVYPERGIEIQYVSLLPLTAVVVPLVFGRLGCYTDSRLFSGKTHLGRVLLGWVAYSCILVIIAFILKISSNYSRLWATSWFATSGIFLAASRIVLAAMIGRWRKKGLLTESAVILGAGEIGRRLVKHINEHPDLGIRVIGFVDDRKTRVPEVVENCPVLGNTEDLIDFIRQGVVGQVLVALPWSAEERIQDLVGRLSVLPVDVRLAPDLVGFSFAGRPATIISKLHMINLVDRPLSGWAYLVKAIEDRLLSSILLLLSLPLFVMISIAIKLETPGPILFRQKRYGYNHQLINVLKFRTMHHHMRDPDCNVQTTKDDPRVTRVGRFLRKTSLDELPQLINVLRGEMSIVGPRPHAVNTKAEGQLFEDVAADYAARHRVKPGITGWAQVKASAGRPTRSKKSRRGSSTTFTTSKTGPSVSTF